MSIQGIIDLKVIANNWWLEAYTQLMLSKTIPSFAAKSHELYKKSQEVLAIVDCSLISLYRIREPGNTFGSIGKIIIYNNETEIVTLRVLDGTVIESHYLWLVQIL
jgi:hypothetical protein